MVHSLSTAVIKRIPLKHGPSLGWQGRDHHLCCVVSALLYAETRGTGLERYRHLLLLLHDLQRVYQLRCNVNGIAAIAHPAA